MFYSQLTQARIRMMSPSARTQWSVFDNHSLAGDNATMHYSLRLERFVQPKVSSKFVLNIVFFLLSDPVIRCMHEILSSEKTDIAEVLKCLL